MIEWNDMVTAISPGKLPQMETLTISVLHRKCVADNLHPVIFTEYKTGNIDAGHFLKCTIQLEIGELNENLEQWFHKNKPTGATK